MTVITPIPQRVARGVFFYTKNPAQKKSCWIFIFQDRVLNLLILFCKDTVRLRHWPHPSEE
jgi:hypothetical protein